MESSHEPGPIVHILDVVRKMSLGVDLGFLDGFFVTF